MGDHQHGGAQLVDALQQHHNLQGALGVQVAGGLVGNNHAGVVHQRPGDSHPLLLAAGELAGEAVALLVQPHQLEHIGDAPAQLPVGGPDGPHGEGQIFIYRLFLNQTEVLKDDAQGAAHERDLPGGDGVQIKAVYHHPALGGGDLRGNQLNQRGLPGAGGSHQKDELPVVDAYINPFQRLGAVVVFFMYINKAYHRVTRSLAQPIFLSNI